MTRVRAAAGATIGLIAVLVIVLAITSGSGAAPPATGAAALVPGDALVYLHVSIDKRRPAVAAALRLSRRFPTYPLIEAGVINRLDAIVSGGGSVDFARDIRPWLGNEAALALLNTSSTTAGSELVLDVAQTSSARSFVTRMGATADGAYRGVALYRYPSGAVLAFVRHYLVVGQDASVRSAIDTDTGQLTSLESNPAYRSAASGEPADRVLDLYTSPAGVQRLLIPQGGLLGAVGALLNQPDLVGTTVALSASGAYMKLRIHSALTLGAGLGTTRGFTPTLDRQLPAGTVLALDVTGLNRLASHVLDAGAVGGIASQIGPLLHRLGAALAAEGADVGGIESLFAGESVVALGPTHSLIVVARTKDEPAVTEELANLEVPLSALFPPPTTGSGQVAQMRNLALDGISAHQLSLAPGFELDYAVFRGLVVVSTSLQGIAEIARPGRPLVDEAAYRAALSGHPDGITSLVFFDLSQLLNLAEQTGLGRGTRYRALAPDIARIRAAGLYSTRGEADSTAELTLKIS